MATRNRFDSKSASEAGKKSAAVRKARKQAERTRRSQLAAFAESEAVENIGQLARIGAADLIRRVVSGQIPVTNGKDAAIIAEKFHAIGRLEAGAATSITVAASLSVESLDAAARALRERVVSLSETRDTAQVNASQDADAGAVLELEAGASQDADAG